MALRDARLDLSDDLVHIDPVYFDGFRGGLGLGLRTSISAPVGTSTSAVEMWASAAVGVLFVRHASPGILVLFGH
jgi:hypothetical protein